MAGRKTLLTVGERAAWLAFVERGREKPATIEPKPRRTLLSPQKPARQPSGRVGRDVVVELHRAEIVFLEGALSRLIAALPESVPVPDRLAVLPRELLKKTLRKWNGEIVSVRMPKAEAYMLGRLLLDGLAQFDFLWPEPGPARIHLVRALFKLVTAGCSRPGKRASSLPSKIRSTKWRRELRSGRVTGSRLLLG